MATSSNPNRARPALYLTLESLRSRLPDFWWSEVERVRRLIEAGADEASFEAAYLEYAAEALAEAEDPMLAHEHAPALWAASHQLRTLAHARPRKKAARRGVPHAESALRPKTQRALAQPESVS